MELHPRRREHPSPRLGDASGFDGMNFIPGRRHPNRTPVLHQLRSICNRFPYAEEVDEGGVGDPVYKVDGQLFAMHHRVEDRMSLWCKAAPGVQEVLVASGAGRYFVPPYVGRRGWIGLDVSADWDEIDALIEESYRRTAPARVIPLLTDSGEPTSGPTVRMRSSIGNPEGTERMRPIDARRVALATCRSDHVEHSA